MTTASRALRWKEELLAIHNAAVEANPPIVVEPGIGVVPGEYQHRMEANQKRDREIRNIVAARFDEMIDEMMSDGTSATDVIRAVRTFLISGVPIRTESKSFGRFIKTHYLALIECSHTQLNEKYPVYQEKKTNDSKG